MTHQESDSPARGEHGIALVLSLFLMMAMSVVGASLMFLSQTETYSSMNYRLTSQARYGAESGIQKTVNYLLNSYTAPTTTGADLLSNYDTTKSPVLCIAGCPTLNAPVILSASTAQASNYPVASVQTAFSTAAQGSLPSGSTTVTYTPYATLLSMQQIKVYGGGLQTIQTWQITSDGTINAGKTATVEVTATLESEKVPATMYAAFGTNGGCGALQFKGTSSVNSYSSSAALASGVPVTSNSGGNVGTNGNLTESGHATVFGSLATPRVGVGSCSNGNVDALTSSGGATIANGVSQLPQAVSLPIPTVPTGVPTTAFNGSNQTLLSGSYGNVTVTTGTLTLCSAGLTCTINVNSIKFAGNATIALATGATVILNVVGQGQTTPIDLTGGSTTNGGSFDPSHFQIQYAGTGSVFVGGTSSLTAMVYAPNAAVTLAGNNDFYGSLVTSTLVETGNAGIHYDRNLSREFFTVGNGMMSTFSWKKY
jgi:Tfp pilus assembly protein PilX